MPTLTAGQSATLTLAVDGIVTVQPNNGACKYEDPVGTVVGGPFTYMRSFGPVTSARTTKVTCVTGTCYYEQGTITNRQPVYFSDSTHSDLVAADGTQASLDPAEIPALGASSGSSLVGWIQSGTGAVQMAVQTALRATAITLEQFGGAGDNTTNNITALQNVVALLTLRGGGTVRLMAGGTYFFDTDNMAGATLVTLSGLSGVVFEGQGATIRTGSTNKLFTFFSVADTNGFTLQDLNFTSGYTTLDSLNGCEWTKFTGSCTNIVLTRGSMTYGRTGLYCLGTIGQPSVTCKGITTLNWEFTHVYYPQLFNNSGDQYFARGVVTRGCGRSYFPVAPISGHDVQMDSQQGGPFSDCLFKVYSTTLDSVGLKDIRLHYKSLGRYAGAGAQSSDEAMFAFDFQQLEAATSWGSMNDIHITCDIDFSAVDTNSKVMTVRKVPYGGGYDNTQRGHKFENITLSGKIRNTDRLTDVTIDVYSVVGGMNWTGDYGQNVCLENLIMEGSNTGRTDVRYNAQVNTAVGQNFRMDGVRAPGLYTLTNGTYGNISIERSLFANLTRVNTDRVAYGTTFSASGTPPTLGNSTIASFYSVNGGLAKVDFGLTVGNSGWNPGVGTWTISLPFTAKAAAYAILKAKNSAGGVYRIGMVEVISGTNTASFLVDSSAGDFGPGVPWTWAAGDFIFFGPLEFPI